MSKKIKNIFIKLILSIGLTSFIIPTSYFTNNDLIKYDQEKDIDIYKNELEKTNKDNNDNLYYGDTYKSIYFNNFTEPVISPNPNLPGFLGYVQPSTENEESFFPEIITWTSSNLFLSWSANLNNHPSIGLINNTLTNPIKPILLSAIHSDVINQSTIFQNQIFAIIGDKNNLESRNHWLIRYDVAKGLPIIDNSAPTLLNMPGSPIPTNMREGAISIAHDLKNNRYIVYYPGIFRDIKNEIYAFSITTDNQLRTLDNATEFAGKSTWNSNENAFNYYLNDNNFLMGLTSITSDFGNNLVFLIQAGGSDLNDHFRIFELNSNLSLISEWDWHVMRMARSRVNGPYGSAIAIPRERLNIKLFSTKISIAPIDGNYAVSYTLVTENPDSSEQFMYTQFNWHKYSKNKYFSHNSWNDVPLSLSVLYVSIKSSNAFIWNNPRKPFEVILTNIVETNVNAINAIKISPVVNPLNLGELWTTSNIGEYNNAAGTLNISNAAVIEYPFNPDNYLISLNDNTTVNVAIMNENIIDFNTITQQGGYMIVDPQKSASELGWLKDQPNEKKPSEITDEMILNMGIGTPNDKTKLIRFPLYSIIPDSIIIEPSIVNILRDNTFGTIEGILRFTMTQKTNNTSISLNGIMNFKLKDLKTSSKPEKTKIELNSYISQTLASSLNSNNISNFFSAVNLPIGATKRWDISEQNNLTGTAKISFTTNKYYNGEQNDPIEANESFYFNATGFRHLNGTNATIAVSDEIDSYKRRITVWDIDDTSVHSLVQINNLVNNLESTPIFNIVSRLPLEGILSVNIRIRGGYYDPNNSGLPNTNPSSTLELGILNIGGFSKINGSTSVQSKTGNPSLSTLEMTNDYLINYINIINPVFNTSITIQNRNDNISDGSIEIKLTLNHAYNNLGNILTYDSSPSDPLLNWDITISGFKEGEAAKNTLMIPSYNPKIKRIFPSEINERNIEDFVTFIRKPTDADVTYTFSEENNIIDKNYPLDGGSIKVEAFVKPIYDENGDLNDEGGKITIARLSGFNAMPGFTTLQPLQGESNLLAQNVLQGNLINYYRLSNGSMIIDKETTISIIDDSFTFNNFEGSISFSYKLNNYFNQSGALISNSDNAINIKISGFKKLYGSTTIIKKDDSKLLESFTSKDFNISLENYTDYFQIRNSIEGSTRLVSIKKISYNNAKGSAIFKVDFIDGFINSNGVISTTLESVEQEIYGFKIANINLNEYILYGIIGGLIILSIIAAVLIYFIYKNKKEEKESSRPRNSSRRNRPISSSRRA